MGCSREEEKISLLLEERGATREKERGGEWDKVEEGGGGGGSRGRKKKAARGERGAKEQKEQERLKSAREPPGTARGRARALERVPGVSRNAQEILQHSRETKRQAYRGHRVESSR